MAVSTLIRSHDWPLLAAPDRHHEDTSMNALSKSLPARRPQLQAVRSDLTFADLIVLAGDNKRLLSDLKVAAEMLRLAPAAVPCDVVWLNQTLFRKSAADFGKTKY